MDLLTISGWERKKQSSCSYPSGWQMSHSSNHSLEVQIPSYSRLGAFEGNGDCQSPIQPSGATASPSLALSPALEDNMRLQQQTQKTFGKKIPSSLLEIVPSCSLILFFFFFLFFSLDGGDKHCTQKRSSLSLPLSRNKQMGQMKDLMQNTMV